jgi:predicted  nucleic acid-binding Zn-ribbon protein
MGMNDNVENLVLEQLRRLNHRFDKFELEVVDLKMRMSAVDEHLAGIMISVSGINNRLDRIDERVGRIERRLDLTDVK